MDVSAWLYEGSCFYYVETLSGSNFIAIYSFDLQMSSKSYVTLFC